MLLAPSTHPVHVVRAFALALAAIVLLALVPAAAGAQQGPPHDPPGPPHQDDSSTEDTDDSLVERVSGANRFFTSVALSQRSHPDGADVVYIATGGQFADALAGGPAAAKEGAPVLFATPGRLLPAVANELIRLDPETVTVLGGPAAVAPPIMDHVRDLIGVDPIRLGGGDRFGTAVAVSKHSHPDGADEVLLATGERFPDALAGAPLAASLDAPVLLTATGSLPQNTADELVRLAPETITVLGGPAAVSDEVVEEVETLTGATVVRVFGAARYETAVAVSQLLAPDGAEEVYVATGVGWADALAGAAAAGADAAPVLLANPGEIPTVVGSELVRLDPSKVVVLGGPSAITSRVEDQIVALLEG